MWAKLLAWRGLVAIGVLISISLWLAFEGKLGFYIHPRYNLFTIVMAGIGALLVLIAILGATRHQHDHDAPEKRPRRTGRLGENLSLGVTLALLVGIVVLPPTTLSSATAANRSVNSADILSAPDVTEGLDTAELFASLTVREWASLLVQNQSPTFYRGKPVNTIGVVNPSPHSDDVFLLTRFVVTCCAVDAQPVSIPVYQPGWQDTLGVDSWVRVEGGFQPAPPGVIDTPVVVVPVQISEEEVPREPYLF